MPLYILTTEVLATHIRANPAIKCICPPQAISDVKLSQYADDTSLLLRDTASIGHTFDTLNLYERASGAKINRENVKDSGLDPLNTALIVSMILTGKITTSLIKSWATFLEM